MDLSELTIWLPTLMLVLARVAGLCVVAPVLSHAAVPIRLRYAVSVVIALAVVGTGRWVGPPAAMPTSWLPLAGLIAVEAAIGAVIGFAARLVFVGIELGAFHAGTQMGLTLAEIYAPAGGPAPGVTRRLFVLTAIVVFLAIGGHRELLGGVVRSFRTVPPATFAIDRNVLTMIVALLGASFTLALKVAAPVLAAMLLATVALGLLQRSIRQCNLLSTGLPIRALLGLAVMTLALAALPDLVEQAWTLTARELPAALSGAR
ncbi:MAG: flagellar biosynthetic protein FliR [Phycisphaerae bacterium]|nr:flagellar biosynthetic protein FliR [Phycisphaerae bacterium]